MSLSRPDNKGNVECPKCRGAGYMKTLPVELIDICDRCFGARYLDWVEAVMIKRRKEDPHDMNIRQSYALDNINRLRNEIIQQGSSLGFDIRVDIEIKPYEYQTRYLNQIRLPYGGS